MDKYLIINADDFGLCHAENLATQELFLRGSITSATIMAPCSFVREAVDFAVKNPALSIGVHLTTTSEWQGYRFGAVKSPAPSLTAEDGFFHQRCHEFTRYAKPCEVESELFAQVELLRSMGLSPSHLDNHMGSLYGIVDGNFAFLECAFNVASAYGLPLRFPEKFSDKMLTNGTLDIKVSKEKLLAPHEALVAFAKSKNILMPDYLVPGDWSGEQDKSYENYREYIYELYRTFDNGVTETYIHPAVECDEIKGFMRHWHRRVFEYRLFSDPKTLDFISSLGIKLISYKELKEIKSS